MGQRWLIIADDLTGAADCGIAFAKVGLDSVVTWEDVAPSCEVLTIDTDSRRLAAEAAAARQVTALEAQLRPDMLVYKKIDSTLRGQPAAELAAQLAALARDGGRAAPMAVIAPAFPGTGRTTEGGRVLINGQPLEETPLWAREHSYHSSHLPTVLAGVGLSSREIPLSVVGSGTAAIHAAMAHARHEGMAAVVCDAASEADLAAIAEASLAMRDSVLWVGSGGLAVHLARQTAPRPDRPTSPHPSVGRRPVLVAVGSLAEASRRQARHLIETGLVESVMVGPADLLAGAGTERWHEIQVELAGRLGQGRDMLVEIAATANPDLTQGRQLAALFARLVKPAMPSVGGLVVTGGDTGCALLSELGVQGIRLADEVEPGVPCGMTIGPLALPVVSKAGAFGDDLTLRRAMARLKSDTGAAPQH